MENEPVLSTLQQSCCCSRVWAVKLHSTKGTITSRK